MVARGDMDEDGVMTLNRFAELTDFSEGFLTKLFDKDVLPGTKIMTGKGVARRVSRRFATDFFAAVHCGGTVVALEQFAADWKAAKAESSAA